MTKNYIWGEVASFIGYDLGQDIYIKRDTDIPTILCAMVENWTSNGIMQYMISMNPATHLTKILDHTIYDLVIVCGDKNWKGLSGANTISSSHVTDAFDFIFKYLEINYISFILLLHQHLWDLHVFQYIWNHMKALYILL